MIFRKTIRNRLQKYIHSLLLLRDKATQTFLVQTRRPSERIIQYALSGDTTSFYREELAGRKLLQYPPFTVLIKISSTGTSVRVEERMQELEKLFAEYKLRVYLPTVRAEGGRFSMHGLLRVPRGAWPDEKLLSLLQNMPPHYTVHVDPDRLLA